MVVISHVLLLRAGDRVMMLQEGNSLVQNIRMPLTPGYEVHLPCDLQVGSCLPNEAL